MLIKILVSVCAVCAFCVSCGSGAEIKNQPLEGYVDLQGHRGARGLRPENTIPAFESCIDHNMTTVELDTNVTADKQLIVVHDSYLNGVIALDADGKPAASIAIAALTVEQLKTYDYGTLKNPDFPEQQPVPGTRLSTLPEVFAHVDAYAAEKKVARSLMFNAELKFDETDRLLRTC
jgi:glycerophosphoryl diester phosphodiesterase